MIEYANRIELETREMYAETGYDDLFVLSVTSFKARPVDLSALDLPDDHVLRLYFIDTEDPETGISRGEAEEVARFVRMAEGRSAGVGRLALVMQCDGGISRSAACAAAAMFHLGQDGARVFASSRYKPSMLVFETVMHALPDGDSRLDEARLAIERACREPTDERFDIGFDEGGEGDLMTGWRL